MWLAIDIVSMWMCGNTFNFFNSLVIFRHYFTGNGKVSCILTTVTISDWFPNKKAVSWFSLVIGQNASRQLATSFENLVVSAQFSSQFQVLSVENHAIKQSGWKPFGRYLFLMATLQANKLFMTGFLKIVSILTHQITHTHFEFTSPKGLNKTPPSDESIKRSNM